MDDLFPGSPAGNGCPAGIGDVGALCWKTGRMWDDGENCSSIHKERQFRRGVH